MSKDLTSTSMQVTRQQLGREPNWDEKQRIALGIAEELKSSPVLYVSAHRGAFDARIPGHLEAFQKIFSGETGSEKPEASVSFDLQADNIGEILINLRDLISLLVAPNTDGTRLPAPGKDNHALPGFIVNVIYLPPLDPNGQRTVQVPAHTFALDRGNLSHILPKLRDFLIENRYLSQRDVAALARQTRLLENKKG